MKYVIISFISLIVGYGSYSLLNSTTESEQIKNLKNELEILDGKIQKEDSKKLDLKKELKEITVRDFIEYQNLKDQKKKFEKANDVFGKVMMLFLAYLDLKQLKPEVDKFVTENNQLSVGEKREVEVIVDPYKDQAQCPVCPEVAKETKLSKRVNKLKEIERADFIHFKDIIPNNKNLETLVDYDIYQEFLENEFLNSEVQPMYHSHVETFLGDYTVEYRNSFGDKRNVKDTGRLNLKLTKDSKNKDVLLDVSMSSDNIALLINGSFEANHPSGHGSKPGGRCRGFKLSSENLEIYLLHLKILSNELYVFGKVVNSDSSAKSVKSYFLAKKEIGEIDRFKFGRQ